MSYFSSSTNMYQERWIDIQQKIHEGDIQNAFNHLLKLRHDLEGVPDNDILKYNVSLQCFEVGWQLTANPDVFRYGEYAAKMANNSRDSAIIYRKLALYSLQKGRLNESQTYLDKCLRLDIPDKDRFSVFQMKGRLLYANKKLDESFQAYMEAERYADVFHQDIRKLYIIINTVDVFCAMGLFQTAISELTVAEQLAKDLHNLNAVIRCMVRKAQVYYSIGENESGKRVIEYIPQQLD